MVRRTNTRGQDLCLEIIVVDDPHEILNQLHAVKTQIIEATDKRADDVCAVLGGQHSLGGGEDQGNVDFDALVGQDFRGAQAIRRARCLHDDVIRPCTKFTSLTHHAFPIGRNGLGGDIAFHDRADLLDAFLEVLTFLGDQRWVGRHSVDQPKISGLANLINIRRIKKYLHRLQTSTSLTIVVSHNALYLLSMRLLGIETSCDETAIAIVEDGRRELASVIASQAEIHATWGGVVPEVASRQHVAWIIPVLTSAIEESGVRLKDIDAVAVTHGPGLAGSLLVGVSAAKAMAWALNCPLVGVNHLEGHIYANWLGPVEPQFPLICLIVSGGHSDLILMSDHLSYVRLGGTRDDAAGEAFDKVARMLKLGYPGGPSIERAAKLGDASVTILPRAWIPDTLDFSFSGLKSAVARLIQTNAVLNANDVAASFQESIIDVLVEKTVQAVQTHGAVQVLLAGGVAANQALRSRLEGRSPVPVLCPPPRLCTDNAAMIAAAGCFRFAAGFRASLGLDVAPSLPLVPMSHVTRV